MSLLPNLENTKNTATPTSNSNPPINGISTVLLFDGLGGCVVVTVGVVSTGRITCVSLGGVVSLSCGVVVVIGVVVAVLPLFFVVVVTTGVVVTSGVLVVVVTVVGILPGT